MLLLCKHVTAQNPPKLCVIATCNAMTTAAAGCIISVHEQHRICAGPGITLQEVAIVMDMP